MLLGARCHHFVEGTSSKSMQRLKEHDHEWSGYPKRLGKGQTSSCLFVMMLSVVVVVVDVELSFVLFMLYQKSGLDLRLFSFLHLFLWSSGLLSPPSPAPALQKQSTQLLPERTDLKSTTYYTPCAHLPWLINCFQGEDKKGWCVGQIQRGILVNFHLFLAGN